MRRFSGKRLMLAAVAALICSAAMPGSAGAAIGNWNSNRGCPVDDPAMLMSPGGDYTGCVGFFGGGPWKLGNLRLRGGVDGNFGVHGPATDQLSLVPGPRMYRSAGSIDGIYLSSPIWPLCPGLPGSRPYDPNSPYALCLGLARQTDPNALFTPYFEAAGDPSAYTMSGVIGTGSVLTLPVKVRLASPALGPNCYVGSDADPILLRLRALVPANIHYTGPDPNGYPVAYDAYASLGPDIIDTTFTVPAASGCGSALMDTVLNQAFGLPSASGNNSFTTYREFALQSTAAGGHILSQAYHAALGP